MRLLLIEDEKILATNLKKALETQSYAVDVYNDGENGLDQALFENYDLIILDVGLPKLDGITVCRRLREEKVAVPILMLTARDSTKDKISGLNVGADDYVVKPFDFEELLARIRALLRRGNVNPDLIYKVDTLEINSIAKSVKRSGVEIKLSSKEYSLLEYLASNKNKILSKSQIIEHVWDSEMDPFSNNVDVYIGYVRNKVDKNFPKERALINTVKGMGYSLKDL